MNWLLILLSLALTGYIVFLLLELKKIKQKYSKIDDVEKEVLQFREEAQKLQEEQEKRRTEFNDRIEWETETISKTIAKRMSLEAELSKLIEVQDLQKSAELLKKTVQNLRDEVALLEETQDLQSFGFYKTRYNLETSEHYKNKLDSVYESQKTLIKKEKAATCSAKWTVEGSQKEGERMTKHFLKLILRAFNGECDAAIAKVKYNNVKVQEARIRKAFDAINKLSESNKSQITQPYLKLRLDELFLTHEYQEKLQAEKEEQRMIREQMAEEARAQKELEKALKDAEKQEKAYRDTMDKLRLDIEAARAAGKAIEKLEQKLAETERRLQEAEALKQRAVSQAQLTKIGHVYVISNIGSFGEDVFKIGMTRRLDPMDRVKELGDASVPFPFDVHAMIYSQDAPALENQLHKLFNESRLNRVNNRKEFFRVGLKQIESAAHKFGAKVEFTKLAEAKEYRESFAYEKQGKVTEAAESSFDEEELYV